MARIIEKIVEAVIEDPVVDIFAEPTDEGNDLAGLVPAINSGPVIRRGRFQQSDLAPLPEERSSAAPDQSSRSTPETDIFSNPPTSGPVGKAGSKPEPSGSTPSRSSTPAGTAISKSNDSPDNDDERAQDPPPDSDDGTAPDEGSDESGATIMGTEGDDTIELAFVFPAEVRNESNTLNGTTPKADVVSGNGGDDTVNGGGGDDVIDGGSGDDTLNGETGDDMLSGGSGDDVIDGGSGDDVLSGGSDDDILSGGDGNDELTGGDGTDQLIGGGGADRFVFGDVDDSPVQAPDLVFDFKAVQGDRIDVSGIDAISDTTEIDEFIFVGDDAFSGSAGELRFVHDGPDGLLEGDVNGDATADMTIELLGVTSLSGDDIMGLG
jgi:Ca2+-binding RTX toxin-like protein